MAINPRVIWVISVKMWLYFFFPFFSCQDVVLFIHGKHHKCHRPVCIVTTLVYTILYQSVKRTISSLANSWLYIIRYYRRAYEELFVTNEANGFSNEEMSDRYRFGWLLFLVLRVQALGQCKDLVTSTNGLVSVLVSHLL